MLPSAIKKLFSVIFLGLYLAFSVSSFAQVPDQQTPDLPTPTIPGIVIPSQNDGNNGGGGNNNNPNNNPRPASTPPSQPNNNTNNNTGGTGGGNSNLTPSKETLCRGSNCPVIGSNNVTANREGIARLILDAARWLTFIAAALAVIMMVWGGVVMITSNGDDTKYGAGKQTLFNATIGLIVAIVAYTIVALISTFIQGDIVGNLN